MIDDTEVRPTHTYVDYTVDGEVTLFHVTDDDDLDSLVLRFTPANAHQLAQMLITAAEIAMELLEQGDRVRGAG